MQLSGMIDVLAFALQIFEPENFRIRISTYTQIQWVIENFRLVRKQDLRKAQRGTKAVRNHRL